MKNLLKKWNESSLVLRILGGLIIGVVLGLAVPRPLPSDCWAICLWAP